MCSQRSGRELCGVPREGDDGEDPALVVVHMCMRTLVQSTPMAYVTDSS